MFVVEDRITAPPPTPKKNYSCYAHAPYTERLGHLNGIILDHLT